MGVFEMVTTIVIASLIAGLLHAQIRAKNKMTIKSQHDNDLEKELGELKKRIETLETIVTDKSYTLKKEFEQL